MLLRAQLKQKPEFLKRIENPRFGICAISVSLVYKEICQEKPSNTFNLFIVLSKNTYRLGAQILVIVG